jgi:RNA polymerase-binding transcription factor DksA
METIRERLEEDLRTAVGRLRMMGGAVAVEELAGAIGDNSPYADEVDEIQENERREIGFATRELLVDRVNRLSAALERLKSGDYGTCTECEEAISPARLQALPEVTTCVRCQDRIERLGRQFVRPPGRARNGRRRLRTDSLTVNLTCQRGRSDPAPLFFV